MFLMILIIFMLTLSFGIYLLYTQITSYVIPPMQDIFYIVQNSYFSLNKDDLSYNMYTVDSNILRNKVENILKKNYSYCSLDDINFDKNQKKVYVKINIKIEPVFLKNYIGNINLKYKDVVKLKNMEVKV